jgi:ribonuclease-3
VEALLRFTAAKGLGRPKYHVNEEGPDHAKHFEACVILEGKWYEFGPERGSMKAARKAAARVAIEILQERR